MAVDTSFSAWLKETGTKDFVRGKVLGIGVGRKQPKTIQNASTEEKKAYNSWRSIKQAEARKAQENEQQKQRQAAQFAGFEEVLVNILNTTSAREIANRRLLEQIQRVNSVDLSIDTSNYIGDNEIESKYPGLIESIFSQTSSHGNSFREEEDYSEVVVTNTINTREEILNHIRWMVTKPSSTLDVELRNVEDMGSWVLQTTENVGLTASSDGGSILGVKNVEKPKPITPKIALEPIQIPIIQIKKDAEVISRSKLIPYDMKFNK
jgi:hypothetical protein